MGGDRALRGARETPAIGVEFACDAGDCELEDWEGRMLMYENMCDVDVIDDIS